VHVSKDLALKADVDVKGNLLQQKLNLGSI
jgi:hypothetical protein